MTTMRNFMILSFLSVFLSCNSCDSNSQNHDSQDEQDLHDFDNTQPDIDTKVLDPDKIDADTDNVASS